MNRGTNNTGLLISKKGKPIRSVISN